MEVKGQHHAPATLSSGKNPNTHWIGDWVDPRADLDVLEKEETLFPPPGYEPGPSSPVARCVYQLWTYIKNHKLLLMTLSQQNAENCSLYIYITISHWTSLHVSIRKGPSSGNQTKTITHKTKLDTFIHRWLGVKETDS